MAGFSAALREEMLKWVGGITGASQPGDFYIQFHNGDPGSTGSANASTGITGRVQLGGTPEWAVGTADDGQIQNSTAGSSGAATGSDTISYFSVWSASVAGDYYFSGPLDVAKDVVVSDVLNWAIGDLKATLT